MQFKHLAYLFLALVLWSCEDESSFSIPASATAKSFVPNNQDSILFISSTKDTLYFRYSGYTAYNQPTGSGTTQEIAQQGYSLDSGFFINYQLTSGLPETDSVGRPTKTDVLHLTSSNTLNNIWISNSEITTSLVIIDSLYLQDSTLVLNALTDGQDYMLTSGGDVVRLRSNTIWYDKKN